MEIEVKQIGNIVDEAGYKNPQRGRVYSADGLSPCLNTNGGGGREVKILLNKNDIEMEDKINYRIRKLTPTEVLKLMDVDDKNIQKLINSGISNSQLYKMAGNSIVVSCLYHIFRKMFVETQSESGQLSLF